MRKQSGTRAGNDQRHTHTINFSPQTQANNAARATNGKLPTRLLYMHLTRSFFHVFCPLSLLLSASSPYGLCRAGTTMPFGPPSLKPGPRTHWNVQPRHQVGYEVLAWLLQSTRAQSVTSQEQMQHKNAKNSQHRDQQLLYFTSVNSNVTDNYSASVVSA